MPGRQRDRTLDAGRAGADERDQPAHGARARPHRRRHPRIGRARGDPDRCRRQFLRRRRPQGRDRALGAPRGDPRAGRRLYGPGDLVDERPPPRRRPAGLPQVGGPADADDRGDRRGLRRHGLRVHLVLRPAHRVGPRQAVGDRGAGRLHERMGLASGAAQDHRLCARRRDDLHRPVRPGRGGPPHWPRQQGGAGRRADGDRADLGRADRLLPHPRAQVRQGDLAAIPQQGPQSRRHEARDRPRAGAVANPGLRRGAERVPGQAHPGLSRGQPGQLPAARRDLVNYPRPDETW